MTMTGSELRKAREFFGLSELALAVQLQVGLGRIVEFEAGKPSLPQELLAPLSRAFDGAIRDFERLRDNAKSRRS
jgi:transcriptional regulator with XRE-family HTH domain